MGYSLGFKVVPSSNVNFFNFKLLLLLSLKLQFSSSIILTISLLLLKSISGYPLPTEKEGSKEVNTFCASVSRTMHELPSTNYLDYSSYSHCLPASWLNQPFSFPKWLLIFYSFTIFCSLKSHQNSLEN